MVDSVQDLAATGLHHQLLCGTIPCNFLIREDIKSSISSFPEKIADGLTRLIELKMVTNIRVCSSLFSQTPIARIGPLSYLVPKLPSTFPSTSWPQPVDGDGPA